MKANGLSLILFGLAALAQAVYEKPVFDRKHVVLTALFLLFFAWHSFSLLFDPAEFEAWKSLERKFSLLATPVIMLLMTGARWDVEKWAIRGFFAGLAVTGLHMLSMAVMDVAMGLPAASFTYHEFTKPYYLGAIYYSWYVSSAIYYLAYRRTEAFIERLRPALGIFFLVLLLLCASKLFIALTIPAILWAVIKTYAIANSRNRFVVPIILLLVVIVGSIPFLGRIAELKNTDFSVVRQAEYQYDTPFNGLTFRMVLWRFAGEIMHDENAWLTGVGIGSRQETLNSYYKDYGIYTGNPELGDKGYLDYNFHNQYLEVLIGTGIPGLLLLLLIIFTIFIVEKRQLLFPLAVYLIVIGFFMTESILERQAGIVFFSLIWTLRVNVPASESL